MMCRTPALTAAEAATDRGGGDQQEPVDARERGGERALIGEVGPPHIGAEPLAQLAEELLLRRTPKIAGGRLKWPDQPLGEYVQDRLRRRARLGINEPSATDAAIQKIHARRRQRNTG
jgi:hypothetical protein